MNNNLKGKRVFIIEDKLSNLAIMQLFLEQHGAVIDYERWGIDTLRRLHNFKPVDLILLDLMFPNGVTGYDVFEIIRSDEAFARVPIAAVSASESSVAIRKTKEQGFSGFIAKPIEYDNFPLRIASLIAGEQVWAP